MISDLRLELQEMLDCGYRENESQYWYPLSVPTYGVEEVMSAVETMCSRNTTMGMKTGSFEEHFGDEFGLRETTMVNSGSSADLLIAFALVNPDLGLLQRGDEVLVPSVTWPTQIWSLMMAGLKVRLVDTDPATLNMSMDDLDDKVWSGTKGLSIVHLMGNPCNMDRVMRLCGKKGLVLVEDCCEALGASWEDKPVGTFGVMSAFSFFVSHHITTMEGGMVCSSRTDIADKLRLFRSHGWARHGHVPAVDSRYTFTDWGFNVRPTEVAAAFGIEQLKKWPEFHKQRIQNMLYAQKVLAKYSSLLRLMQVAAWCHTSWFALPFMVADDAPFTRDELTSYLEERGVETRPIVAGNIARQPAWKTDYAGDLPGADAVHDRGFYVGLHPVDMTDKLDRLAGLIGAFVLRTTKSIDGGEIRMPLIIVEEDKSTTKEAPVEPELIKCPKCGSDKVYLKYVKPEPSVVIGGTIKHREQPERMKRECGRCGYYWHTACNDAANELRYGAYGYSEAYGAQADLRAQHLKDAQPPPSPNDRGYYDQDGIFHGLSEDGLEKMIEEKERRRKEMTE